MLGVPGRAVRQAASALLLQVTLFLCGLRFDEGECGAWPVERFPLPYQVARYLWEAQDRLDGRQFSEMFISGNDERVCEAKKNVYHDTAVGYWRKSWAHWSRRGASEHTCLGRLKGSEWVRCTEDVAYEQWLAALFDSIETGPVQVEHVV